MKGLLDKILLQIYKLIIRTEGKIHTYILFHIEGKIFRYLKDALSYLIRDIYNKNVIGVDSNVDRIINEVVNILFLPNYKSIKPLSSSEQYEVDIILVNIENDPIAQEILLLKWELDALECFRKSKISFISEKEKSDHLEKYNKFVAACKSNNHQLTFDSEKPTYKKLKKSSYVLFKEMERIVTLKNINDEFSPLSTVFYSINKLIPISLLIIISCSSIYELGYFYKIGFPLNQLPVDYSDMVFLAFKWAPSILVPICIIGIIKLYELRLTTDKNSLQIREEYFFYAFYGILIGSILLPHYKLSNIFALYFLILFICMGWIRLVSWVYLHPKIAVRVPLFIKYIISYILPLIVLFLLNGYFQASEDLASKGKVVTLELIDNEKIPSVKILRNFRSGILYQFDNKLYFVPISQIRIISLR